MLGSGHVGATVTLDNMEQHSRRDCLKIKRVPIQDGEDTDGIVKSIGESIGVQLEESDTYNTRLASKQSYYLPQVKTNYGKFSLRYKWSKNLKLDC